ncbi:hypothetical protein METBIDRAFT_76541 [Metschnikowia bicuspidata var. bicuspidata NRRL YB-4993]|uniref:VHS domain-containing protein n=1 Tax=Metschnikowia bicuspidata var. bicuspidata NRRL YB-4993 TaxID=869754 RepID=A0A1A0HH86_9ASCO|nr:hypothetical protein METBIDRAFT_76541 [Metschnikowia bicuspidata var. bicuspidata NRRL YB-4993]OBA23544.1 hypothetical protein METBIDRAFT_76541 [Metschnikowia bicuspidata var. bicuspidata NRRL YB-4993]
MPIFGEKPFTSITVKVNQLCTLNRNADLEDDSMELYVPDLVSLIKLQSLGAVEAARAIRKKIKYGNTPAELVLALDLLELLVLNAGSKIGQAIAADDKLGELLRAVASGLARSGLGGPYDGLVVRRVRELARGWRHEFQELPGYGNLAGLYKAMPRSSDKNDRSSDRNDRSSGKNDRSGARHVPPPRPQTKSPYAAKQKKKKSKRKRGVVYADEQYQIPQINYRAEAPKIRTTIADCHTHTTALDNALLALARGSDPMDDAKAAAEFERCRKIRRKVLRYLQYVGAGDGSHKSKEVLELDDEFLGSLLVANDQLVASFHRFDAMCGYTPENPAQYHQDDRRDDASVSSGESYYTSDSDDESAGDEIDDGESATGADDIGESAAGAGTENDAIAGRLRRLDVNDAGSDTDDAAGLAVPVHPRDRRQALARPQPVARQDTAVSTESGDPFGDRNEVSKGASVYY